MSLAGAVMPAAPVIRPMFPSYRTRSRVAAPAPPAPHATAPTRTTPRAPAGARTIAGYGTQASAGGRGIRVTPMPQPGPHERMSGDSIRALVAALAGVWREGGRGKARLGLG